MHCLLLIIYFCVKLKRTSSRKKEKQIFFYRFPETGGRYDNQKVNILQKCVGSCLVFFASASKSLKELGAKNISWVSASKNMEELSKKQRKTALKSSD